MSIQPKSDFVTVDDYLASEDGSTIRHEYIGGQLYAMTGSSDRHNLIATNIVALWRPRLRGTGCQLFVADMKVRLIIANEDIFYYPDVMVCCDANDRATYYRTRPCLIVEILSGRTQRIDRREKLLSYQQIESLQVYLILSQQAIQATVYRREQHWRPETFTDPQTILELPCAGLELPLAAAYEDVPIGALLP